MDSTQIQNVIEKTGIFFIFVSLFFIGADKITENIYRLLFLLAFAWQGLQIRKNNTIFNWVILVLGVILAIFVAKGENLAAITLAIGIFIMCYIHTQLTPKQILKRQFKKQIRKLKNKQKKVLKRK